MAIELTRLDDIYFSANLGETLSKSNTISNYPTEDKQTVSENIQNQPLTINFSGIIINEDGVSANESLQKLRQYMDEGKIMTYTGRNIVYDVVIEGMETVHNAENSTGYNISLTLKKIRVVTPETFLVDFSKIPKPIIKTKNTSPTVDKPNVSAPAAKDIVKNEVVNETTEGTSSGRYEDEISNAFSNMQKLYEQ